MNHDRLLKLLQLASPAMPLGAFSYSEGLETLVELNIIGDRAKLQEWLTNELGYGAIRIEAALMLRAYDCCFQQDLSRLSYWNSWLSAARETAELRQQSWQMGNTLIRLLQNLENETPDRLASLSVEETLAKVGLPCNYAIAFGITAACWQIDSEAALIGYLHSWVTNAIGAGVKLIPLGQTVGQQILISINPKITVTVAEIQRIDDENLHSCSWGLSLASSCHEIQYTRLFRS
jgi:urease accessory protein